jgi:hypothetical protein
MVAMLRRFWFEFDPSELVTAQDGKWPVPGRFSYLSLGCGITAYDYQDALGLLRKWVIRGEDLPRFSRVIEDIDVSTLDAGHVLPNAGCPVWRGVWFPALNLWYGPDLR